MLALDQLGWMSIRAVSILHPAPHKTAVTVGVQVARLDRNGGYAADGRSHALSAEAMERFRVECPYYTARRATAFAAMAAHHELESRAAAPRLRQLEMDAAKLASRIAEFLDGHAPKEIGWAVTRIERAPDADLVAGEIATQGQFAALHLAVRALGRIGERAGDARMRLAPRGEQRLTWHVAFVRALLLPWHALTGAEATAGDDDPFARFVGAAYATLGGTDRGWGSQIETALADVADWPRWDAFDSTGRTRDPGLRTYPDATAAEVGISRMRERVLQNADPGSHALLDRFCDLQLLYTRAATGDFMGRFEDVLQIEAAIRTFQGHIMGRVTVDALKRTSALSPDRSAAGP